MPVTIRQVGPCFAGEVSGIDMRKPMTAEEVAAIHAGMDKYAVLVFRDQDIDDAQQLAFSLNFGPLVDGANSGARDSELRLPVVFADVSNLDRDHAIKARDDRHRLFALANRLWHSDSSFRAVPAKYSILSARIVPPWSSTSCLAIDKPRPRPP